MTSAQPIEEPPGRRERSRERKRRVFLDAAQRIVADEGFEALTMSRLAAELDTVVSAVYRYFSSKGALIAEIQKEAVERLTVSLTAATDNGELLLGQRELAEPSVDLTRLVLFGRWLCATSETYPQELRLLQMIMAQRVSALDPGGGERVFPAAIALLSRAAAAIERAQASGAIRPGNAVDRAVIWSAALGGVLETDDLEQYSPELFGGTRLAQQANLDLIGGWGADPDELLAASSLVDELATHGPLAP